MTRTPLLAGTALALCFAFTGLAQAQTRVTPVSTVSGTTRINDAIDDIEERTADDFEESQDEARFGTAGVPDGFRGGVFASGSATSGNTDTLDFGLGLRATYGQGRLNHTFGAAVEYGEDNDTRNNNFVFGIYDLNYDVTDRFYVFGLARGQYDEFNSIEQDYFLGAGPGLPHLQPAGYRLAASGRSRRALHQGPERRRVRPTSPASCPRGSTIRSATRRS